MEADIPQPRQPGMGGLCNRARDVEVKHRLRSGSFFGDAPPPRVTASGYTVAIVAIADEINVNGQSQSGLVALLKGVPPAIRQSHAVSSIWVGWVAAAPP